jgi:hypothetical protein
MAHDDYKMESENDECDESKENTIQSWVDNGANSVDAAQLWDDMINDPYHADSDIDVHFDSTIDDRIEKYSSKNEQL